MFSQVSVCSRGEGGGCVLSLTGPQPLVPGPFQGEGTRVSGPMSLLGGGVP